MRLPGRGRRRRSRTRRPASRKRLAAQLSRCTPAPGEHGSAVGRRISLRVCESHCQGHHASLLTGRVDGDGSLRAASADDALVFTTGVGTPLEPRNVLRSFHSLCDRAQVRRVRIHDLRHAAASFMLLRGVDMRVVMGTLEHSRLATTSDLYTHLLEPVQRAAADRMESLLRQVTPHSGRRPQASEPARPCRRRAAWLPTDPVPASGLVLAQFELGRSSPSLLAAPTPGHPGA